MQKQTRGKKTRVRKAQPRPVTVLTEIKSDPGFELREYQRLARQAFKNGIKRLFLAWHRRAGKDATSASITADDMDEHPANYWHMFPFHSQGRRAMWNGVDPLTGMSFLNRYFPLTKRKATNQTDMLISMENGATWQILGSDNYEKHIGAGPRGVVFSEYAQADPNAWQFIRPILSENGGWAIFPTTFRGRNHAFKLYEAIKDNPLWYADLRTIRDTKRLDGSPVITEADVEEEIKAGMSRAVANQEYYCNPLAINEGAYFAAHYDRLQLANLINERAAGFTCAAWHFSHNYIAATVYAPMRPAILGIHTYEGVEFTEAYERFRAHWPRLMHHITREGMGSIFETVNDLHSSEIPVSTDMSMRQSRTAWLLNNAVLTERSQYSLTDVLMDYTIDNARAELPPAAVPAFESLAIAAQHTFTDHKDLEASWNKKPNYSVFDRGVI